MHRWWCQKLYSLLIAQECDISIVNESDFIIYWVHCTQHKRRPQTDSFTTPRFNILVSQTLSPVLLHLSSNGKFLRQHTSNEVPHGEEIRPKLHLLQAMPGQQDAVLDMREKKKKKTGMLENFQLYVRINTSLGHSTFPR